VRPDIPEDEKEFHEIDKADEDRYILGRDGDHLMGIPFQCDLCHFRNMTGRNPIFHHKKDEYTMLCVRRANLDAMWAREPGTVKSNLGSLRRTFRSGESAFGFEQPLPALGPFPLSDTCGMKMACLSLDASLRKGKYADHLQWDSMRSTPGAISNMWRAGIDSMGGSVLAKDEKKLYVTSNPARTEWFERFMKGAKLRIGVIRRRNFALTSETVHALLELLEKSWQEMELSTEKKKLEEVAVYVLAEYCGGLRGEEVPLISLAGMLKYWEATRTHAVPHVMMTLHGRFKGETGERWHLLPIADETRTKLPVRKWFGRLIGRIVEEEGRTEGWLFQRKKGRRGKISDYDGLFKDYMDRVKDEFVGLIPENVNPLVDMSLWRSGRRGSTTEVSNQGLDQVAIDMNNRWRKRERSKGGDPSMSMRELYTQVENSLATFLRYAQCL
jgi:hypothetical protein